ncbi:hypothetical protein OROMI_016936 [Orobanche minor]
MSRLNRSNSTGRGIIVKRNCTDSFYEIRCYCFEATQPAMIVLTSARFFDCSANESAKLCLIFAMVHSPVKETAVNVDVAVRELPHANTKPDDLWRNHSKVVHPRPTGRIALRGAQFKRQSVIFDINARGYAVYTSINADKKAFSVTC